MQLQKERMKTMLQIAVDVQVGFPVCACHANEFSTFVGANPKPSRDGRRLNCMEGSVQPQRCKSLPAERTPRSRPQKRPREDVDVLGRTYA